MAKTPAEKQKTYIAKQKREDGDKYLEKEREKKEKIG